MAIEYFCCYHSYRKKCEKLTDQELGRLFRSLLIYSETGERQELAGRESIAFDFIADDIDRAKAAYEERCRKNRENGARANGTERPRTVPNAPQSKNKDKDKDKDNPLKGGDARARFAPPTLAEVQSYVAERHSPVDPQEFIDFYAAKGWMVGKTPMKDWKAACRNAEKWDRWDRTKGDAPAAQPVLPGGNVARMRGYLHLAKEAEE